MATAAAERMREGTVVRDRLWGGTHTGTVARREGTTVWVAWHGTCVEDELDADQVEVVADPTPEQRAWRGGVAYLGPDGSGHTRAIRP